MAKLAALCKTGGLLALRQLLQLQSPLQRGQGHSGLPMTCTAIPIVSNKRLQTCRLTNESSGTPHAAGPKHQPRAVKSASDLHASDECKGVMLDPHLVNMLPIAVEKAARTPVQRALCALALELHSLLPALQAQLEAESRKPWSLQKGQVLVPKGM